MVPSTSSISTAARRAFSEHLVACNVYISVGQPHHAPLLLKLLQDSQDHCSRLRAANTNTTTWHHDHDQNLPDSFSSSSLPPGTHCNGNNKSNKIVVVHAYADGPYDRSSFHLAGNPVHVATVASQLAVNAITSLQDFHEQHLSENNHDSNTRHPKVGLVDHVAIMPLPMSSGSGTSDTEQETYSFSEIKEQRLFDGSLLNDAKQAEMQQHQSSEGENSAQAIPLQSTVPSGWVARAIGSAIMLQQQQISGGGIQVLFYGNAHPDGTPLATIRREATQFFKNTKQSSSTTRKISISQATIGAPTNFVENYNIRLKPRCSYEQAKTLTKYVRARDGGLPGVEALTLPYSDDRYEVACNLLQPHIAGATEIENRVREWEAMNQHQQHMKSDTVSGKSGGDNSFPNDDDGLVEIGYRVGTTVEQCLHALDETCSSLTTEKLKVERHDATVQERLRGYLLAQH